MTDTDTNTDTDTDDELDVYGWVVGRVHGLTSPDPDGIQHNQSNVWTSEGRIRNDARKTTTPFDYGAVDGVLPAVTDSDDVFHWNGLLAPATDDHLLAIIENEQEADITRSLLIGQVNQLRARLRDDPDQGQGADPDQDGDDDV